MNMKLIPLALLLSIGAAQAADEVTTESGTVHFTGSVVSTACAVDAASSDLNVNLGQVRLSSLGSSAGTQVGTRQNFDIKLVDCDATTYKNAQVTFKGVLSEQNSDVLEAGQGVNKATGVGIQIFDQNGKALPFGTASEAVNLTDGTNTLHFQSGYISTQDAPTAGDASASSTFTITYS